jgi:hypothetical protein
MTASDYKIPEATGVLTIEDGPFAGAEIRTRLTLSPGVYFAFKQWAEVYDHPETGEERLNASRELATLFVDNGLIAWNLTHAYGPKRGEPVPATAEGIMFVDLNLIVAVVRTWFTSIGTVPVPLAEARRTGRAGRTERRAKRRSSTAGGPTEASSPTP